MRDVKSANGFIVARVDSSGNVTAGPDPGPIIGRIGPNGEIYDDDAGVHQVGRVDGEGNISNTEFETVGRVDSWGRVYSAYGDFVGTVGASSDSGVLVFLMQPAAHTASPSESTKDSGALMAEALDLANEQQHGPGVRKAYKPLTDRDLFIEHLPRE